MSSDALQEFVRGLHTLLDEHNRGRLAALRRGLGQPVGTPGGAAREFYRLLPPGLSDREEPAYWTAATLFAAFPPRDGTTVAASVAGALRRLTAHNGGEDALPERRLLQLLASRPATLATHLRGAASLLAAGGIVLDPGRLVEDVRWWDAPDKDVQRRWAREFWRARETTDETAPEDE
jgi:CRISPR system Cascade subunit CasB